MEANEFNRRLINGMSRSMERDVLIALHSWRGIAERNPGAQSTGIGLVVDDLLSILRDNAIEDRCPAGVHSIIKTLLGNEDELSSV